MKETYVKPQVYFESFSLSQTIARDCGDDHQGTTGQSNHWNEDSCVWYMGPGPYKEPWTDPNNTILFMADNSHCNYPIEEKEDIDGIEGLCYNNPEGADQVFSST